MTQQTSNVWKDIFTLYIPRIRSVLTIYVLAVGFVLVLSGYDLMLTAATVLWVIPVYIGYLQLKYRFFSHPHAFLSHLKGENSLDAQDYKSAVDHFSDAIAQNPAMMTDYAKRADAYFMLRRFEDAVRDLTVLIDKYPKNANHYAQRGNILLRMDEFERAMHDFEAVVRLNPRNNDLTFTEGVVKGYQGDYAGASEAFLQVLAVNPTMSSAHSWLSNMQAVQGNYDKAIEFLNDGLTQAPHDPVLGGLRAYMHALNGDDTQAEADVRTLQTLAPPDSTTHYLLGFVALAQHKLDDAITHFEQSDTYNLLEVGWQVGLAITHARQGNQSEVVNIWHELVEADKRYTDANDVIRLHVLPLALADDVRTIITTYQNYA